MGQKIVILSHRPASVLHTVENPDAGSQLYRQSETFFQRCTELRRILESQDHG